MILDESEDLRNRLEEKNRQLEKKNQAVIQAQQERNQFCTELKEMKDIYADLKDINVLQRKVAELHTRVAALEALLQGAKEANRKSQQQQEVLINFQQEVLRNFVPLAKIFFLLVAELLRENTDLKRYAARMRAKVASQEALLQDAEEATRKLQQQQKEATRKLQQMQKLELQQETIEVTRL
ncbi:unnamed protein product [Cyprideis torosa]|uniref:Uncharacterized protein n=1 Tax=Cyprideis torosa TaxID=163714 RepID=A0A7R8ZSF0_9CRUS|nr:unnamed protein product [Cyprideis torosa]CAG0901463.1 unnamed protein product [Cyprideis torosa]